MTTNRRTANTARQPRTLTLGEGNPMPFRTARPANTNTPLLTIERAIADDIDPAQLYMTADHNDRRANVRLQQQAANLRRIADKMVLLGFGRGSERSDFGKKVAA